MKMHAQIDCYDCQGPDSWDDSWGVRLPLDHVICRDIDGTPHMVREFIWPWTAYTKNHRKLSLHFYYWNQRRGRRQWDQLEVSAEREARILELQFLMTRQIYYGAENAPKTLEQKLATLHHVARFAESRACKIQDVLTNVSLLIACGQSMPDFFLRTWMAWIKTLVKLDSATQLGFTLAISKVGKDLISRGKNLRRKERQHALLPTRVYGELINNLSSELDDIEAHACQLVAALQDALLQHAASAESGKQISIGPRLIKEHGLDEYLIRRGFSIKTRALNSLSAAVTELFEVCKLQIHLFSGMRHDEALTLPYHCMVQKKGNHGRSHSLIAGITTKFNKGRSLRTHWVTTDRDGFRAIRLAQRFASLIYESLGITPSKAAADRDKCLLFPSVAYLPWGTSKMISGQYIQPGTQRTCQIRDSLHVRLCPFIEEEDMVELDQIDPFRAWRDEPQFAIGKRWTLNNHQLRRSLAIYANASGLVGLSSLRRQLQHITREMSLYYGRGSTFCKNFIADDPLGYKKHVAREWQSGVDEAAMLTFTRDVLNSKETMFGGAGNFYQRQKNLGTVMSREEVAKQMKAGLLGYQASPLGGCTKPGGCDKRKGLALIDISCATEHCKNLVGKHSKIVRVIQLKRASMAHITQNSIEDGMENEELDALERVECEWRSSSAISE